MATIPDDTREHRMTLLVTWAEDRDLKEVLLRMPRERNDPDGEEFEKYFDTVQMMYYLQSEARFLEEDEVRSIANRVAEQAKEFRLPLNKLRYYLD